jgi:FKBP-type peptidyl-prolyl cis-trans isomerase FklB
MRLKWYSLVMMGAALSAHGEGRPELKSPQEMTSYSIGVDIARNFRRQEIDLDPDLLAMGLRDGLSNGPLLLPEREVRRVLSGFRADLRRKMVGERKLAAVENKRRGEEFLAANRSREGVVSLPSGVQYKVLKPGNGRKPTDADRIVCQYRGTLLDGTEFDGTERGKPATLEVARLIPGWKEALRRMPAGSRWQIAVPPQLAYGERGVGSEIGPNETLLFEVELLAVKSGS